MISIVRDALIAEQRGLCAYTGLRIDASNMHIDHINPQRYRRGHDDVLFSNLVASISDPDYGGHARGDWPSPEMKHLFVTPLMEDCECKFAYEAIAGRTVAADGSDSAAVETIAKLGLNHKRLVERRRARIRGAIDTARGTGSGPDSWPEAYKAVIAGFQAQVASQSQLGEFSFVLIAVFERLLQEFPPPSNPPDGGGV